MKSRLPIIAALIVAIAAVIAIRAYLRGMESKYADRDKGPKVVAATVDIKTGTTLELSMLTAKQVPERFLPSQAIRGSQDNVKIIVGQKVAVPVKAGQTLLWSDLVSERRTGFESVIPSSERAFTVKMSSGIKGSLMQPGDHVDILVNFAIPEAKGATAAKPEVTWRARSEIVNIVLLQNVTVLAVGDTFLPESQGQRSSAGDITVAVTIPEAQLLMFAAQHGDLAAVLRKHNDVETLARDSAPRVTFESLEKLVGDLDSQRKRRIIDVMKGGTVEHVMVDEKKAP